MRLTPALLILDLGCQVSTTSEHSPPGQTSVDETADTGADSAVDTGTPDTGAVTTTADTGAPAGLPLCGTTTDAAIADGVDIFYDLQSALDSATTSVTVCPGTYVGTFVALTPLHILGEGGAAVTILDGDGDGRTLDVLGGTIVEGLTITGGNVANGAGLRLQTDAGTYTVRDCIITGNVAKAAGGGVWIAEDSIAGFPGTTISLNEATGAGGGMYAERGAVIDLTGATLSDNVATGYAASGGGLYHQGSWVDRPAASVLGGTMTGNVADGDGGGVYAIAEVSFEGTTIEANEAMSGGGIFIEGRFGHWDYGEYPDYDYEYVIPPRTVTLTDGVVRDNVSTSTSVFYYEGGGGICAHAVDLVIEGSTVIEHNVAASTGGGLHVSFGTLVGGELVGNEASNGGGMYLLVSDATDVTASANVAEMGGGAVLAQGSTLENSFVEDNTASVSGGGIAVYEEFFIDEDYGWYPSSNFVIGTEIRRNVAADEGGGIDVWLGNWQLVIEGSILEDNEATTGGGLSADAGLIDWYGDVVVDSSSIIGNVATNAGGGVWMGDGPSLESESSDWGDGGDDNVPDDVALPTVTYVGYTAAETFTCESVCDPAP